MTESSLGAVGASPSLFHRVTRGVSWMALAQVGRRAWSLLVTAILARLLTPGDFGLIALTLLSIGVISMFSETGLTSALVQRADLDEEHFSGAFWVNLGVCTLLAGVGAALSHPLAWAYHEPRIAPLVSVMMLTLPLAAMGQVSGAILQKRLAFRTVALVDGWGALVSGAVGIALALGGAGVWALVGQYVALAWASALGRAWAARWNPVFVFNRARVRELIGFSLSVLGCSVVNYLVRNVDNALVGGALGAAALGFYSMAYNLVLMPGTAIGGMVGQVMFPALSSIQGDLPRLRGGYGRALRMLSLATFPFVVGMGVTAPLLVQTIYGPKWGAVVPLLEILSVVGLLESINICGVVFLALGRANVMLGWALVSLTLMTLSFCVGVRFGAVGVAWSYVLVSPIVSIVPHLLANRMLKLSVPRFLGALAPALGASLLMGAAVRSARALIPPAPAHPGFYLLGLTLLGALVYAGSLAALAATFGRGGRPLAWLTGEWLSKEAAPPLPVNASAPMDPNITYVSL